MPDALYTASVRGALTGAINFGSDTFFGMLVTSGYVPNKDTHDFRNDVTSEVSGPGYVAGGKVVPVVVQAVDAGNDDVEVTFGPVEWTGLTVSGARQLVVYKRRGGAASADELIYCHDFGSDVDVVSNTLTVSATTLRFTNPG